ncbi:MAG: hypothetical protein Q9219_001500 [cf. Caloplaca sp. 3 TL-2023]
MPVMLIVCIVFLLANVLFANASPASGVTPISLTAGNAQENDDPCPQYSRCGRQGELYWNNLIATLASPAPADKADNIRIFNTYYGTSLRRRHSAGQEVEQDLIARGLSPIEDYRRWHVFCKPDGDVEDSAYQNLFNADDGVIIATSNHRKEDSRKRLQWSDLVYQTYRRNMKPGQSFSRLRAVVQVDIVNSGTWNVARAAYESLGLDVNRDNQWRRWTRADQKRYFYGFLGTDNVKGTMWLLNDHPIEIGKKVITEILTRSGNHLDIWISLGPYDASRDGPFNDVVI